jgi:hypothetical protein
LFEDAAEYATQGPYLCLPNSISTMEGRILNDYPRIDGLRGTTMGKKRRFWFSRTFLIIVGSIFALLILVYGWGFQTLLSWKLRHEAKCLPVLAFTPQPLPVVSSNDAVGTKLSNAGYWFEVPWDDLNPERTKFVGKFGVFVFRSGRVISFFPPGPPEGELLATAEKSFGDKDGTLRQMFGAESVESNYAFEKTLLESTPTAMRPWMSKRDAVRTSFLLLIKGVSSVGGETGIFKVTAGGWNGFQLGDPAKSPKKVTLELYDAQDRHIEIIFGLPTNPEGHITQADINRVLETLKPSDPLATQARAQEKTIATN